MKQKRNIIFATALTLSLSFSTANAGNLSLNSPSMVAVKDNTFIKSNRPQESERLFKSDVIEKKIKEVTKLLRKNPYLAWMFQNCYPNTLDTTVHFDGKDDTFVVTGDIPAMWLRDSSAQVWPYLQFANKDENLRKMLRGVILRQLKCINIDPYANAFNMGPTGGEWQKDWTDMKLELHERKYEIDSLCYPIRLAYEYWKITGDTSIFGEEWQKAVQNILKTFREQQRKDGHGPYSFMRETARQLDTVCNAGFGSPVNPVGLIASVFRPSDDATTFLFLVPSNFMAVSSLNKAAEILNTVNKDSQLASNCTSLANEVHNALQKYAVVNHPKYGKIYAFEVDMIWPMTIMMKAFTSNDDAEIKWCIEQLMNTDAGKGFIHESFNKNNPSKYTRDWFAWQNTLFGELIIKLIDDGKLNVLLSAQRSSTAPLQ